MTVGFNAKYRSALFMLLLVIGGSLLITEGLTQTSNENADVINRNNSASESYEISGYVCYGGQIPRSLGNFKVTKEEVLKKWKSEGAQIVKLDKFVCRVDKFCVMGAGRADVRSEFDAASAYEEKDSWFNQHPPTFEDHPDYCGIHLGIFFHDGGCHVLTRDWQKGAIRVGSHFIADLADGDGVEMMGRTCRVFLQFKQKPSAPLKKGA